MLDGGTRRQVPLPTLGLGGAALRYLFRVEQRPRPTKIGRLLEPRQVAVGQPDAAETSDDPGIWGLVRTPDGALA